MAYAEVPSFHNPLERLGHTVHEIPAWMGRHYKSLTLTIAALGGAGYVSIQLARPYTLDTQVKTTAPVSDTFKPTEPEPVSVIIPALPIETATPKPSPTAIPASTEVPATATASPAPEPPKPTPTPDVPKPAYEKTFPTGLVEKYDMVTEKNFDRYFSWVPQEQLQKLLQEQPNLPLFPFIPLSDQFSMGETVSIDPYNDGQKNTKIIVYSPHLLVIASDSGSLKHINTPTGISGISLIKKFSETTTSGFGYQVLGEKPKLIPKINAPDLFSEDEGQPVKKGDLLAEFLGSGTYDSPGKYSAKKNQISVSSAKGQKLPEPIIVDRGGKKIKTDGISTPTTPLLNDPTAWVHTADGRIAIMKP